MGVIGVSATGCRFRPAIRSSIVQSVRDGNEDRMKPMKLSSVDAKFGCVLLQARAVLLSPLMKFFR